MLPHMCVGHHMTVWLMTHWIKKVLAGNNGGTMCSEKVCARVCGCVCVHACEHVHSPPPAPPTCLPFLRFILSLSSFISHLHPSTESIIFILIVLYLCSILIFYVVEYFHIIVLFIVLYGISTYNLFFEVDWLNEFSSLFTVVSFSTGMVVISKDSLSVEVLLFGFSRT